MVSSDADPVGRVLEASGLVLERARLLGSKRPIVVAVSGGADSLCLLDAMMTLLEGAKRRIVVGHVDHKLRSASAADAEHVRAVSDRYGIRCEVIAVDVPSMMANERRGLEEAARIGRYRALGAVVDRTGASAVVTGHTRDDSVETVLLNLVRGSGKAGLAGISPDERFVRDPRPALRVVRPLLDVTRANTVACCEARGIRWLTDETNTDPSFARNRVRGHLLPVLRTYNPSVDQALARMANVMRDEDAWLDQEASRRWVRIQQDSSTGSLIDLAAWRREPAPIRRRIVRLIAASLGHEEVGFDAVERALAVGTEGGPPRAELGAGMTVGRRNDTLFFERSQRTGDD